MTHPTPAMPWEVWWFYAELTGSVAILWATYRLAARMADRPKKEDRTG